MAVTLYYYYINLYDIASGSGSYYKGLPRYPQRIARSRKLIDEKPGILRSIASSFSSL
jgi:hypothetical protein